MLQRKTLLTYSQRDKAVGVRYRQGGIFDNLRYADRIFFNTLCNIKAVARCGEIKYHNYSLFFITFDPPKTADIFILSSLLSTADTSSLVNIISAEPAFSISLSSFLVPGIAILYGSQRTNRICFSYIFFGRFAHTPMRYFTLFHQICHYSCYLFDRNIRVETVLIV